MYLGMYLYGGLCTKVDHPEGESRPSRYPPFFPCYMYATKFRISSFISFYSNNAWNMKPARDAGPLERYIILTSMTGQHGTRYKTTTRSLSIDIAITVTQPFKDPGDAPKCHS